ncbi:DUF2752 domain-containing protein [Streptomyces sp. NPDC088400]|uniref:DUF2752 domain-containing protein n=1 Tax=Streptomyces sp. NPDC088400 TaxID=3365861 RepID=UPI0038040CE1
MTIPAAPDPGAGPTSSADSMRPVGPVGPAGPVGPGRPVPPPASLARRLLPPLATLAGVAAAFTYVGLVDPNETGHYPVCPLYGLTGLYCPACGGLRSAHAVAHGDLAGALGANAPAVVGYAVFAVLWTVWIVRAGKGLPVRIGLRPVWWWALGGVILAFTVIRNLPFGSSLAP